MVGADETGIVLKMTDAHTPTRSYSNEYARQLDARDPLARFRDEFVIDDPDTIYLDGNSLGRLPKRTAARLHDLIER